MDWAKGSILALALAVGGFAAAKLIDITVAEIMEAATERESLRKRAYVLEQLHAPDNPHMHSRLVAPIADHPGR